MLRALLGGSDIVRQGARFQRHLAKLRSELGNHDFPWYPYDSLGNVPLLDRLLQGPFRSLLDQPKGARVLDIGCADGDLAFFLESLGFRVTAIDHPDTNHNGMQGVRKLKEALNSKIEILTRDVDSRFELPEGPYDLVIFLGILYHLKNPYYLLELLARRARFCLLSTRVTRLTPDGLDIRDSPVAYLLGPEELNQDWTNYWIFSEAGLKRLIFRTGWDICGYLTVGDTRESNPHTLEHDERAFCLIRNRRTTDPGLTARLVSGWHELEEGRWRWTERIFSVELPTSDLRTDPMLELEFVYPDVLKHHTGSIQIHAQIGDTPLSVGQYSDAGEQVYRVRVPLNLLTKPAVLVKFELNQALPPDSQDRRERGIIALSVGFH
jgi:tRNA (mo5U34)-methyltransferase